MASSRGVVLDNAYVFALLTYGVINTVMLILGYIIAFGEENKMKDRAFFICTVVFILMGFTEKYFVDLMYNFTLLFLTRAIYKTEGK
jgi:hypothetical protein